MMFVGRGFGHDTNSDVALALVAAGSGSSNRAAFVVGSDSDVALALVVAGSGSSNRAAFVVGSDAVA
jgi:hypothetical protein